MTTDFRALCVELTDCLEKADWPLRHRYVFRQWIDIARAALADEPAVPEGREPVAVTGQPSDEALALIYHDCCRGCEFMDQGGFENAARAVLARWGNPAPLPPADGEVDCISIDEMCEILRSLGIKAAEYTDCTILYELTFEQLRAICDTRAFPLSRRTPAPAADGEVAELVAWLREIGDTIQPSHLAEHQRYKRAAELLQRQVLVPVPVSERLPGPGDCDGEGRCWYWRPSHPESGYLEGWMLRPSSWGVGHYDFDDSVIHTHWLPAHALPLPEVK